MTDNTNPAYTLTVKSSNNARNKAWQRNVSLSSLKYEMIHVPELPINDWVAIVLLSLEMQFVNCHFLSSNVNVSVSANNGS